MEKRHKGRLPYLIIAGAVLLISTLLVMWPPLFVQFMESKSFDIRFLLRGERPVTDEIVIVAIDEESIAGVGRWPWPREKMAELIGKVAGAGAKTIGVDILFTEAEKSSGHAVASDILEQYLRQGEQQPEFLSFLKSKESETSGDNKLAQAIAGAGNVILPFAMLIPAEGEQEVAEKLPEDLFFFPFMVVKEKPFNRPIIGSDVLLPIAPLLEGVWSIGSAYT